MQNQLLDIQTFQQSITVIKEELWTLRSSAEHLKDAYGEAATVTDLTFIKIIEEQYEHLVEEIGKLSEAIIEGRGVEHGG